MINQPTYSYFLDKSPECYSRAELYCVYTDYLLQKAMSVYKWELPKYWDPNYFLYTLYLEGSIAVFYTHEFGVVAQKFGIYGYSLYEMPTHIRVSNSFLTNVERRIDKDAVIIHFQPNYKPIISLVMQYAQLLAECHLSILVNLRGTKTNTVFAVKDKKEAEKMKLIYDQVDSGQPAVLMKENMDLTEREPWFVFSKDAKNNYIVEDILNSMNRIDNRFNTDIGLNNTGFEKKERLTNDEVNSNNEEIRCRGDMWLQTLKEQCRKTNEMFNLNLSVDWRVKHETSQIDSGKPLPV